MCCLFGFLDYKHNLTRRMQNKIISALSVASEDRGKDATGIAYNCGGSSISIYKRPFRARKMNFHLPREVTAVMRHTRMTTQGNERFNYNNHPFRGRAGDTDFALAHNGMICNDFAIQKKEKLPASKIETDSYVAVQLIEKAGALSIDSLRYMAEKLEGSFAITALDREDNLYFVKGDNPMCIYHYPDAGIYLYASTEEILQKAIARLPFEFDKPEKVPLTCGDILTIDRRGGMTKGEFSTDRLFSFKYYPYSVWRPSISKPVEKPSYTEEYIGYLKHEAACCGYSPNCVDNLLREGYTTDEIEEMLYCGVF